MDLPPLRGLPRQYFHRHLTNRPTLRALPRVARNSVIKSLARAWSPPKHFPSFHLPEYLRRLQWGSLLPPKRRYEVALHATQTHLKTLRRTVKGELTQINCLVLRPAIGHLALLSVSQLQRFRELDPQRLRQLNITPVIHGLEKLCEGADWCFRPSIRTATPPHETPKPINGHVPVANFCGGPEECIFCGCPDTLFQSVRQCVVSQPVPVAGPHAHQIH